MNKFRVIIAGSRGFNNYQYLRETCEKLLVNRVKDSEIHIVSGCAKGADQLGMKYANAYGYRVDPYPAQWDEYGKSAGYIRNCKMAENADALIAFWDGESRGTKHMIEQATKKGLLVRVIRYDQDRSYRNL